MTSWYQAGLWTHWNSSVLLDFSLGLTSLLFLAGLNLFMMASWPASWSLLPLARMVFFLSGTCLHAWANLDLFVLQVFMTSRYLADLCTHWYSSWSISCVAYLQSWTHLVRFFLLQVLMTSWRLACLLLLVAHMVFLSCAVGLEPTGFLLVSMTSWCLAGIFTH